MKILIISSFLIFKETRFGGVKRLYYLVRELQKENDVFIISMDGCQELPAFNPQHNEFKKFFFIDTDVKNYTFRQRLYGIDLSPTLELINDKIEKFLENNIFDAALLAYPLALSFAGHALIKNAGSLIYIEDDFFIETTKNQIVTLKNPIRKLLRLYRYFQLLSYYPKKLRYISRFIAITQQEADFIKSKYPFLDVRVVKYGIEPKEYPFLPPPAEKNIIGFIGNFRHPPNARALDYFLGNIFPYVKYKRPEIKFISAGRYLPERLKLKYSHIKDVLWLENVSKIDEFYRNIHIFVVPVISGRGLRTKIIESVAFGRPILATPLGAEGLEDLKISIVKSKEEYFSSIDKLISEPIYYKEVVDFNRNCFERNYTIQAVSESLMRAIT